MMTTGEHFRHHAARYLLEVHLPRLRQAALTVPEQDLWWRPHPGMISIGNILLHLEGNVRQWILSGLGKAADHRVRASEFAATDGPHREILLERLQDTVAAAAKVISDFPSDRLTEPMTIQGIETSSLDAMLHVVEHFSWHTGQAVWIAKARAGVDHGLAFYDDSALNAAKNRP